MADFLAKKFVAVKLDAEKGEGPELAKKYGVRGFPTIVFLDQQGEEIDRLVGFRPPDKFIAEIKAIQEGKSFKSLKKKAADHPADLEAQLELGKKYEERDDYKKAEELYNAVLKAEQASASLKIQAEGRLALAAYQKSMGKEAAPLEKFFEKNAGSGGLADQAFALFYYYQRKKEPQKAMKAGDYLLENGQKKDDAEFLNNYAWYLATEDVDSKKALGLAKKAVELSPKAAHIADTLAEAHFRNGQYDEAVAAQKKAVELARDEQKEEFKKRLQKFEKALEKKKNF